MKCHVIALLALLGPAVASRDTTPVEKVVNLLKDLQTKIGSDGKSEEQIYNKYACWAEKTTHRKATDITNAENDLRALGQQILKLKGKVATLSAEIKDHAEKIGQNEDEQEEATSLRQRRNGKFMSMQSETKEALAATEKAIEVLVTGTKLLQTDAAVQATSAVQVVVDKIPIGASLNNDHMAFLGEFIQSGGTYAPQSATIQGILTDMYNTFGSNLEDATVTEAKQNKNYEKLTATLQQENIDLNTVKSRKEGEKADAESDLADTTQTYDDTTDQMKADIKFFDETKEAAESTHAAWTTRADLRDEELAGVQKALDFLTSDNARDLFAESIKPGVEAASFLQIAEDNAQSATMQVYGLLKAQATKSKSMRLASLAVRVRTTKVGHFDAVIKAIDDMMSTLNDEGEADRAKKTQCEDEYQEIAKTVQDADWKIKNNEAKIDKLEQLIEMREGEKQDTIDQIQDTNDYVKKITDDRHDEHNAFKDAQEADKAAIILLNKAKDALTAYSKKNKIDMGPIQGLVQEDPAFAVSEDQAPEAKFAGKGSSKVQSKGIVSMMDYIIQDLEDEVTNDGKNEAKSQADFEAELKTASELLEDLKAKKVGLTSIIAKRNGEKTEENRVMGENNKDRDAELSYQAKIKPDCDWIMKAFSGRAEARSAEMSGLVSAKEFLAGKAALFQLQARPIGFLRPHH